MTKTNHDHPGMVFPPSLVWYHYADFVAIDIVAWLPSRRNQYPESIAMSRSWTPPSYVEMTSTAIALYLLSKLTWETSLPRSVLETVRCQPERRVSCLTISWLCYLQKGNISFQQLHPILSSGIS